MAEPFRFVSFPLDLVENLESLVVALVVFRLCRRHTSSSRIARTRGHRTRSTQGHRDAGDIGRVAARGARTVAIIRACAPITARNSAAAR